MKYEKMNRKIIKAIGGEQNIQSVIHCATRLRFVLKDESKANDQEAEAIDGVLQVVKRGGQYQLVIGNNVDEVYNELIQMIHLTNNNNSAAPKKKKGIVDRAIGVITGSIAPAIPLLAGAGMGKVLILVLTLLHVMSDKSQTYQLLNLIFDAGYYFMPAYVGFSAAKIFNTDRMMGAFVGLMTVDPKWVDIVNAHKPFHFLGLPVPLVSYSSTLITAILSVWIMSYVYNFLKKITPGMIKVFMLPMLTMLIMGPLVFMVIGPISNWLSQGIAFISMWLFHNAGLIAIPILAAVYPWLVSVGIHTALSPISIQLVATQGFDPIIRTVALCSNMAQAAASLAVGFKSKNKKLKALAFSSSATAFLGGITEPALFGVNLRLRKPMYGAMIGGAVSGILASFFKIKAFIFVTPAILSLPMWVSKTENYVLQAAIIILVSAVVTFVAVWLIGFDDPVDQDQVKAAAKQEKQNFEKVHKKHELHAPVKGKLEDITKVKDPTFASGVMGKGIAIVPSEGKIFAPDNGVVTATFKTKHAIGLHLNNDADLLIHIGIDTIEMNGQGFKQLVKKGDKIKAGQELIDFDIAAIKKAGHDPTVIMIITNPKDFLEVLPVLKDQNESKTVTNQDNVMILA